MPMRKNFGRRRPAVRRRKVPRRGVRKLRVPRGVNDSNQIARIKETLAFANVDSGAAYSFTFQLDQFERASTLAPNFKWYKAAKVEWTLEPLFNTFTDDGTPQSMPYLYVTMNRTQDSVPLNLQDLQAMGCKPQKLTSKNTIAYRPNWCSPGLISYFKDQDSYVREIRQGGLKAQYAWLQCPNTNGAITPFIPSQSTPIEPQYNFDPTQNMATVIPAQVVYNGHNIYIDQALASQLPVARLTCTVHWEFKGPHYTAAVPSAKTVVPLPPVAAPAVASP